MTRVLVGVTALFIALVVHEAGHAVTGWFAGFRFELLGVGRDRDVPAGRKLR